MLAGSIISEYGVRISLVVLGEGLLQKVHGALAHRVFGLSAAAPLKVEALGRVAHAVGDRLLDLDFVARGSRPYGVVGVGLVLYVLVSRCLFIFRLILDGSHEKSVLVFFPVNRCHSFAAQGLDALRLNTYVH